MLSITPAPIIPAQLTFGAITRVQSKTATTGATSATTLNLVFDSTPTAGNLIVIACCINVGAYDIFTTTNINYSIFTANGSNQTTTCLFIGRVFASASATITINPSASANVSAAGAEYSGGSMLRLDKGIGAVGSSTSAASGATATTSTGSELWIGALGNRNTNNGTIFSSPTNGFAIVGQTNTSTAVANADRSAALLERIVTSTGTANAGATAANNNAWGAIAATFEQTPTY